MQYKILNWNAFLLWFSLESDDDKPGSAGSVRGRDVDHHARDERAAGARRGGRGAAPGRRPRPRREHVDSAARAGRYVAAGQSQYQHHPSLFLTMFEIASKANRSQFSTSFFLTRSDCIPDQYRQNIIPLRLVIRLTSFIGQ